MRVRCPNCNARWEIPAGHQPSNYYCGNCGYPQLVPVQPRENNAAPAVGALGGAALGAAMGGPMGAVIGGVLGLLIGAGASKNGTGGSS